jgi:hypothetical protein
LKINVVYKQFYKSGNSLEWNDSIFNFDSYKGNKTFQFLNIEHQFKPSINFNFGQFGKLWTYNLNYFDYLNQDSISKKDGLQLINQYIYFHPKQLDGSEPYPISLRSINWMKFLSKYKINDNRVDQFLFNNSCFLINNFEYHIMGNHLLENAFCLLFSSYYFENYKFYNKSKSVLFNQLDEQILNDGGHFELSPMYHKIILSRILDCIQLIKLNSEWVKDDLLSFLEKKASLMISWLQNITYTNGKTPMVNDATYKIAPSSKQLFSYAKKLDIINKEIPLSDSGYRKINFSNYELFVDVGNIGPDYQPGHAHSDTFNFEFHLGGLPVIVDTGISTYEKNEIRQLQRSTKSHNTVMIDDFDQSEVWGGFRVARRAKVSDLKSGKNQISATHNGYKRLGIFHNRCFEFFENEIIIKDSLTKSTKGKAKAIFHFHSNIKRPKIYSDRIILEDQNVSLLFTGHLAIDILSYDLCEGFNKIVKAYKTIVSFDKDLKTQINL